VNLIPIDRVMPSIDDSVIVSGSIFAWLSAYRGLAVILLLPLIASICNCWSQPLYGISAGSDLLVYAVVQSGLYMKFLRANNSEQNTQI